jgi:hypothetical protein
MTEHPVRVVEMRQVVVGVEDSSLSDIGTDVRTRREERAPSGRLKNSIRTGVSRRLFLKGGCPIKTAERSHSPCEVPFIFANACADERTPERARKCPVVWLYHQTHQVRRNSAQQVWLPWTGRRSDMRQRNGTRSSLPSSVAVEWFGKNKKIGRAEETPELGELKTIIREHISPAVNAEERTYLQD